MKAKPYFQSKNFVLYNSDSIDFINNHMSENSVDMIFADPPYFLSSGTFTCQGGKRVSVKKGDWDLSGGHAENFAFHVRWIEACMRVLKPGGTIWISGTYHSIYQCGYALQLTGFKILNDISWFKPNASPNLSGRYFTASHESLIWARKGESSKHVFNYELMKNWDDNYKKKFFCSFDNKKEEYHEILHEPGKQMRSVWAINTPGSSEKIFGKHPTQKPIKLLERVILASTNKGQLILDPFTGSSTTGLVAVKYGRRFIGIDTEKKFLDLSIKRYKNLNN